VCGRERKIKDNERRKEKERIWRERNIE